MSISSSSPVTITLFLRSIGYIVSQTFSVRIVFRHCFSMNDGLAVCMREIDVVGHRKFLSQNKRCGSGKQTEIPG